MEVEYSTKRDLQSSSTLKQGKWRIDLYFDNELIRKALEVDKEENEDVTVRFEEGKIVMEAETISKLRGVVNTYLRLIRMALEVMEIERCEGGNAGNSV